MVTDSASARRPESVERWLNSSGRQDANNADAHDALHVHPASTRRCAVPVQPVHPAHHRAAFTPQPPLDLAVLDPDRLHARPAALFLLLAACLASALLGLSAALQLLTRATGPPSASVLDRRLNWSIGVPVSAVALVWALGQLAALGMRSRTTRSSSLSLSAAQAPAVLVAADIAATALLGVGAAICAVLAGFQAARHASFNRRHTGRPYRDVGAEEARTALLAMLTIVSFCSLALALCAANRRRRSFSSSSSVIEIIRT